MAVQYSIFSVLSSQIKKKITLFSMMMPIGRLSEACSQLSSFWNSWGSSLLVKCMNGNLLSNCILLKNMWRRTGLNTCVGVATIRWNFKNEASNIKCKRPRFAVGTFLYTCGCMMIGCTLIIAQHAITRNTLMGCYV